jgi:hypothetical protein
MLVDAHNIFSNQNKIHDIEFIATINFVLKLYSYISDIFLLFYE